MKELLLVLNPRHIPECVTAIEALDLDKLWISYLTEPQIEECWDEQIVPYLDGYDRVFAVSDDAAPHEPALDHVRGLLDEGHPVATGYCNLGADDFRVNLCAEPYPDPYRLIHLRDVQVSATVTVSTSFAGFTLTGMSAEMWVRYPFRCVSGHNSDLDLCKRLHADRVPIVAHRSAFVWHVKENWSTLDTEIRKRLLIGERPSRLRLDRQ